MHELQVELVLFVVLLAEQLAQPVPQLRHCPCPPAEY